MKTLINALTKAPISEEAESVLTDLENWIESKIVKTETRLMKESIIPIQKENESLHSDIRILAETMKHGFELANERFEKMNERIVNLNTVMNERFEKMDQKMDFIRENLESRIDNQQKLLWAVLSVVVGSFLKSLF